MERFFRLFNKEFSKISEAAFVLGIFTLGSQLLAIVRDRLLAGDIGPGGILDAYYAAFRIPDLLFTLGAALVSVSILMPFFAHEIRQGKEQALVLYGSTHCSVLLDLPTELFLVPFFT
jgi:putative peptidoglycan lipid II flippase